MRHELRWGLQGMLSTSPAAAGDALWPAPDHSPVNFRGGCRFVAGLPVPSQQQAARWPRSLSEQSWSLVLCPAFAF